MNINKIACHKCSGTGKTGSNLCQECGGTGNSPTINPIRKAVVVPGPFREGRTYISQNGRRYVCIKSCQKYAVMRNGYNGNEFKVWQYDFNKWVEI